MSAIDNMRDALFGNPPEEGFKPSREGVLAAFTELQYQISNVQVDIASYATVAALPVVTGADNGTQARVYADGTATNNTYWIVKAGAWVKDTDFINAVGTVVDPKVALAQEWAVNPEDDAVTGYPGQYSAYHWAQKALDVLGDAGIVAISADLTGANTIGDVAAALADITIIATDLTGADTIGTVASNIADIGTVADDLTGADTIGLVGENIANINAVAADLALGGGSLILTEVSDAAIRNSVATLPLPGTLLVSGATINPEGYTISVTVPGDYTAATFDATKLYVHSVPLGYETNGAPSKFEKIARGTSVLRKPYPNHTATQITYAAGITTIVFSLSDFVNTTEADIGTPNSGWKPWVFFEAGWMTVAGVPQAREGCFATNSATKAIGICIAANMTGYVRELTGTAIFEIAADGEGAQQGRTVAACKLVLTGVTSGHIETRWINAMSISTYRTSDAGGYPALVYATTVDMSVFTAGEHVTEHWVVYPWHGLSINSSTDTVEHFEDRTHIVASGQPKVYCKWDPAAGTANGTPSTTEGSAVAGNNLVMVLATAAAATSTGKMTDVELVFPAGTWTWNVNGSITNANWGGKIDVYGPVVRPTTGTPKSTVIFSTPANGQNHGIAGMRIKDVTIAPVGSARIFWDCFQANGTTAGPVWLDNCDVVGPASEISSGAIIGGSRRFVSGGTWTKPGTSALNGQCIRNLIITESSLSLSGKVVNGLKYTSTANVSSGVRIWNSIASFPIHRGFRWNCALFSNGGSSVVDVFANSEPLAGASFLNMLLVRKQGTGPMLGFNRENNIQPVSDVYFRHVAWDGARGNLMYEDQTTMAAGTFKRNFRMQYSIPWEFNNKDDVFAGNAANVHNWACGHHCGFKSNFYMSTGNDGGYPAYPSYGAWTGEVRISTEKRGRIVDTDPLPEPWVDTSVGVYDYRPVDDTTFAARSSSIALATAGGPEVDWTKNPLHDMVPINMAVCSFDLLGNARLNDGHGAAGPIERQ